jgi:hypothetical protein
MELSNKHQENSTKSAILLIILSSTMWQTTILAAKWSIKRTDNTFSARA